jgi:death-on-curing family protein
MIWPDPQALIDILAELFEENETELQVRSMDDFEVGLDRARNGEVYDPDADIPKLAALIFEGVATRHPLIDGNKRLAWLSMTTFLDMNGLWFDPTEYTAYEMAMAVVTHEATVEDMAAFIRENLH